MRAGFDQKRQAAARAVSACFFALGAFGISVASIAQAQDGGASASLVPFSSAAGAQPPAAWHFSSLPDKTPTRFEVTRENGQRVLKIEADHAYGNLVQRLQLPLTDTTTLGWRWRVVRFPANADIRNHSGDDSAVRVCLYFDDPAVHLSLGERAERALLKKATGEELPSEGLCYVWDNRLAKGTVLDNTFTKRIRMIVLESAAGSTSPASLASSASTDAVASSGTAGAWMAEQRNIATDYRRAFGLPAGAPLPVLTGIAVSGDSDNTRSQSLAYLSDLSLRAQPPTGAVAASPRKP